MSELRQGIIINEGWLFYSKSFSKPQQTISKPDHKEIKYAVLA